MNSPNQYPDDLKILENKALNERREVVGDGTDKPHVGVALSGGGIRSATQCLGAFQALKEKGLEKEIDYLSTVSGGGYFGTFWGRANIEGDTNLDVDDRKIKYLRNSGNYIAPSGSGELLKGIAQIFARWLALLVVMLIFLFTIFMGLRFLPYIPQMFEINGRFSSIYFVIPASGALTLVGCGLAKIFTTKKLERIMFYSLATVLGGLGLAIVDTIGLNMYRAFTIEEMGGIGAVVVIMLYILSVGRKISLKLPDALKKYSLYIMVFTVVAIILGTISGLTHYVAWEASGFENFTVTFGAWQSLLIMLGFVGVTGGISFFLGKKKDLLNNLSLHGLFHNRLVRGFMGAAVPERLSKGAMYSTDLASDDIKEKHYKTYEYGAPLHIINLTLNETIDGRSNLYQLNRRGCNLAIIPTICKSLGVRHHATVYENPKGELIHHPVPIKNKKYHVWGKYAFKPEEMTIGGYMAISAAAVSTGMGRRSSLVRSLVTGLLGVRLGYWWNSGVKRKSMLGFLSSIFTNQRLYLKELSSQFFGTAQTNWYLSDGGHFDNLGMYELIRRELKFMIAFDHSGDIKYNFSSLAELTRTVRADFGAEVRWMTNAELDEIVNPKVRSLFGSKANMRKWQGGLDGVEFDGKVVSQGTGNWAKCYATVLEVTYSDGSIGHILYIKPNLIGGEQIDVLTYYQNNPSFPQQSTADQFFDEEQWESYRKLMEHIVSKLFEYDEKDTPNNWLKSGIVSNG